MEVTNLVMRRKNLGVLIQISDRNSNRMIRRLSLQKFFGLTEFGDRAPVQQHPAKLFSVKEDPHRKNMITKLWLHIFVFAWLPNNSDKNRLGNN